MKLVWVPQTFSFSDHPKWQDLVVSYVRKSVPRGRGQVALENSRRQHCFSREMMSVKRLQKFHTDDVSAPKSGWRLWLVEANFPCRMTNQKHYPEVISMEFLGSFLRRQLPGKPVWCRELSGCFLKLGGGGGEERGTRQVFAFMGSMKKTCVRDAPEYRLLK